jgi:polyhydroxyalkanoate synthesis regulator phasin
MEPIFFTPPRTRFDTALYKSGGGSAPAPDPAIGPAALANAQLGKEAFDWYKQEYTNSKPAQDRLSALAEQVQQQLVDSGELNNEYAKDYHNYMTDVFRPLEKSIVENANNFDTAGRREAEASQGLADVRQSFDTQRQMMQRNNERMGINPNSGNAQALNQQMDVAEAVAGANAANSGRKQAEQMGTALKMDAASLGRNLPSNQATSQNIANASATGAVGVGLQNMANNRAQSNMVGQGFNTAMQGYSNQANILNSQYGNQLNAWQANNANNNAAMAGLGQAAGTAATLAFMSNENIKTEINEFDENEALEGVKKTEVKTWKYDPSKVDGMDSKTHVGPMAQDLNKNFGDAVSDGKTVDVISDIGLNMAATKALAKKVDALAKSELVEGEGTETSDSVPTKLSVGEFVQNAGVPKMTKEQIIKAAKKAKSNLGLDTLRAINEAGLSMRGA